MLVKIGSITQSLRESQRGSATVFQRIGYRTGTPVTGREPGFPDGRPLSSVPLKTVA